LIWHHYAHDLPEGAVALAHSAASLQAFRLGTCWGVQFHPEVTEPQLGRWIGDPSDPPPDPDRLRRETREQIGGWNELGRRLCRSFLATAERLGAR
jgi:GMP synthase (glutamine-hydrolysing)